MTRRALGSLVLVNADGEGYDAAETAIRATRVGSGGDGIPAKNHLHCDERMTR